MHALASPLMIASAAIVFALGTAHLVLTFRGTKLHPRDPGLKTQLEEVSPVITRQTTMWKAWIGFNASHSYGAMLFGLIYGYLALAHAAFLFGDPFLLAVGLVLLGAYLVLAKRYWFSTPFIGISLALVLYALAIAASLA